MEPSSRFMQLYNNIPPAGTTIPKTNYRVNDRIGERYLVKGLLGRGGMGTVYLVFNKSRRLYAALKTYNEEGLLDAAIRKSFRKEAELWIKLPNHPNILKAHWVEEISGRLYIEMELVPPPMGLASSSLDSIIIAGSLGYEQIIRWSVEFCLGIEHAYKNGLKCHRDIKPSNILIDESNQVNISDFGLAELHNNISNAQVSAPCGTYPYMPPEQFEPGNYDVVNDIYSFGVVLYEMLTKRLPFNVHHPTKPYTKPNNSFYEWKQLHSESPIPLVDGKLGRIIMKCLAKQRSERYESFADLRKNLLSLIDNETLRKDIVQTSNVANTDELTTEGANLATLGHYAEALALYEKALDIDPTNVAAWCNKGFSLVKLGQTENAMACIERSIELDGGNIESWLNRGECLRALGRLSEAIECYDQALERDPNYVPSMINKGQCLATLGYLPESLRCFDKVIRLDSKNAKAWHSRGNTLVEMGDDVGAFESFQKALDIDPTFKEALFSMALVLLKGGNSDSAIDCLDHALEIDPNYAEAWFNRGCIYGTMSEYSKALNSYRRFLELAPVTMDEQIADARNFITYLENKIQS